MFGVTVKHESKTDTTDKRNLTRSVYSKISTITLSEQSNVLNTKNKFVTRKEICLNYTSASCDTSEKTGFTKLPEKFSKVSI